jgi:hypothetical protein
MSTSPPDFSKRRRSLLLGAAFVPAAGVAASMRTPAIPAVVPEEPPTDEKHRGYHETDHIRTYYRLAGLM